MEMRRSLQLLEQIFEALKPYQFTKDHLISSDRQTRLSEYFEEDGKVQTILADLTSYPEQCVTERDVSFLIRLGDDIETALSGVQDTKTTQEIFYKLSNIPGIHEPIIRKNFMMSLDNSINDLTLEEKTNFDLRKYMGPILPEHHPYPPAARAQNEEA